MLDGDELRLAGEGEAPATEAGLAGDLRLRIRLAPHPLFRLDGRDLILNRPVSALRMLVGGALRVPLPGGVRSVTLPAGSAAPRALRIEGAGFPGRGAAPAGALIVQLVPVMPADPDAAAARLIERLERELARDPARHLAEVATWEANWLPQADRPG
jgi:molecular chaperone DnaJ